MEGAGLELIRISQTQRDGWSGPDAAPTPTHCTIQLCRYDHGAAIKHEDGPPPLYPHLKRPLSRFLNTIQIKRSVVSRLCSTFWIFRQVLPTLFYLLACSPSF